ncbi:MAG: putative lipid II flippase FtsW [Blastocatellia bacterium]
MTQRFQTDWFLFLIAAGLALFGAMMVYSASAMIAQRETQGASQFTYFNKQITFTFAGIAAMWLASRADYRTLEKPFAVYSILVVTISLLLAVFAFPEINGARRWIRLGGFSLQPSELTKVALPIFLAYWLTRAGNRVGDLRAAVIPCIGVLVLLGGLVFLEPDLGTTIVLCSIFSVMYFAAGARILHIASVAGLMVIAAFVAVILTPWRVERLMAFLDPFAHSDDAGYQVVQSLYALGSGGVIGEGFAKGQQKLFYLPYPYSDFIFSVIGEEWGLIGTLGVLLVFGLLLWRGARASVRAADRFGMLLGIGLITGIIVQALFNISVVTSLLPAKGIPLPFISYGGTSVVVTMIAIGIILSISRLSESGRLRAGDERVIRKKGRVGATTR